MFNNEIFDSWLTKKSNQILSKIDRETISTEEMIILVLKAQTNHFDHMDRLENRLHSVDKKIDNRFMWMIGITIAMSGGIYLKLFLG